MTFGVCDSWCLFLIFYFQNKNSCYQVYRDAGSGAVTEISGVSFYYTIYTVSSKEDELLLEV